jgi:hypothetical protein
MAASTAVSVEVTPEAAARIEQLGLRPEFEKMVEHTKQTVDDLQSIEVVVYDDPYEPGEPRMVITAWRSGPGSVDDPTWDRWVDWAVRTFPPDVCRWFGFHVSYRRDYGR